MAVYRVDVLVDDPEPIFNWLSENVDDHFLVRKMAYETVKGWYMKVVFKRQLDAESFHRKWHPESDTHTVTQFK